jgi:hypothetical protein
MFTTKNGGKDWTRVADGGAGGGVGVPAYLAPDGQYYVPSLYGMMRSPKSDLMKWESVSDGRYAQLIGTGKNMLAATFFSLDFVQASTDDPKTWTQLPTASNSVLGLDASTGGRRTETPTTPSFFMVYDEPHHLVYASNYWVVLRMVLE